MDVRVSGWNKEKNRTAQLAVNDDGTLASGLQVPAHDDVEMFLVGATNNLDQVVFRNNGEEVARLQFEYFGGVPTTNDAQMRRVRRV